MKCVQHLVSNGEGWLLSLWQAWDPAKLLPGRRPVVIVPGYGMNSYIFSYHPGGLSLEAFLAREGLEVWRVDFRGQGGSVRNGGHDRYDLAALALTDLTVTLDAIAARSRSGSDRVDIIGTSLGGALMFAHAVLQPHNRTGTLVSMGSPVKWVHVNPLMRFVFGSPEAVGQIRFAGTRKLAALALPLALKHLPALTALYVNPTTSDVSAVDELVKTIENPNRHVNRELAAWMHRRDLIIRGENVSGRLREITAPLLTIAARQDGIVPLETASYVHGAVSSRQRRLLVVGDETTPMAHADLFLARNVHEMVFRPVADWLLRQADEERGKMVS